VTNQGYGKMKIGILETGLLNETFVGHYDPYPVMFAALLDQAHKGFEYRTYSVIRGEMPESTNDCDGWLITGSRFGAYEKLGWMQALEEFIRKLYRDSVPLVGICFGHQIIAQALGGKVVKSDRGWGIGLHYYRIDEAQEWMDEFPEQVGIYAFHQDQVVTLPPQASVFSSSDFCPYAGLSYADSIISIQGHPEFEEDYELALINTFGGNRVPQTVASEALEKIQEKGQKADTKLLADWLAAFFISHDKQSIGQSSP
jgi:GMP synthase-like glutamine amidotransferase